MVSPEEAFRVVLEVTCILDELQIPYAIGGSLASSMHGIPRSTQDADLVADLRVEHVQPFVAKATEFFYIAPERMAQAIQRRSSFNLLHLKTAIKVDVFVLKSDPLSRLEMSRRQAHPVPGEPDSLLQVASPEDIILQKLLWYQMGNRISGRQWDDVVGVLKVQRATLDFSYLRKWAVQTDIENLLKQAYEDAGLDPAS